jgi:hypothetical protein
MSQRHWRRESGSDAVPARTQLHPLPAATPRPAQRARLIQIHDNLIDRITEAHQQGWLGEVDGLNVSLAAAATSSPS